MMASKDARLGVMGELLRHISIVKSLGWEDVLSRKARAGLKGFRAYVWQSARGSKSATLQCLALPLQVSAAVKTPPHLPPPPLHKTPPHPTSSHLALNILAHTG